MSKTSRFDGKKYLLVSAMGLFGPVVRYTDSLGALSASERREVNERTAALWMAREGRILRIKLNGHRWRGN